MSSPEPRPPRVGLFVTCLVDLFRPSVGFAAVTLLEQAGCRVEVPDTQTCCGQPAWNSGDRATTRRLARQVIETFEGYDHVVAPSGSCASMIRNHYSELFADDPLWKRRAEALAVRCHELTAFLVDVLGVEAVPGRLAGSATYHDSCSGLRELGVKDQPRRLLAAVEGLEVREMEDAETCCGFGGTFCVKYPDISEQMVSNKVDRIRATEAGLVLGGDLGCLLNIAGRAQRIGAPLQVRHVAEVLAGMTDGLPAIGERDEGEGR